MTDKQNELAFQPKPVFLRRDAGGQILSVSRVAVADHPEVADAADQDVAQFLRDLMATQSALEESDLEMIRVVEDLIDILIKKEVLRLTDLPDSVQAKLVKRRKMRGSARSLSLLGDRGSI